MNRLMLIIILILTILLIPLAAVAFFETGSVPLAANHIADQMDSQLMARFAGNDPNLHKKERIRLARARIMIMGTTPVDINNLEVTSPLGRQMAEEVARRLVDTGYRFQELRKGQEIRFNKQSGEFLLTRDVKKLAGTTATAQAVLTGTYVVTPEQVRFSMRLIHVNSNEVLAMGTATVAVTDDILPLLEDIKAGSGNSPSVGTRLK